MNKFLITHSLATFIDDVGDVHTVLKSNSRFEEVVQALKKQDIAKAKDLVLTPSNTKVKIKGNKIIYDGEELDDVFTEAYQVAKEEGLDAYKLDKFFGNLKKNPSPISIKAFSHFVGRSKMPITDRGTFLAYKKIRGDNYKDIYTNTFDNRPGCVVSMPRSEVNADQTATCSTGFHVCSYEYLNNYGGATGAFPSGNRADVVVVVECHPKDVVAVPPDYDMTKMRLASYRVLCTLDNFKRKLLRYEADALGNIPIFNTSTMNGWNVMSDVSYTDDMEKRKVTPVNRWLDKREQEV